MQIVNNSLIQAESLADAYEGCLRQIMEFPSYVSSPRGQKINEIIGLQIEISDASQNLFSNPVRDIDKRYLAQELALYYAGKKNLNPTTDGGLSFGKASKFWNQIANSDKTVNSAYGNLLFNLQMDGNELGSQWEWCIDSLVTDQDSRQAIAHINRPFHCYDGNKDFVCTMSYHFFIRDDKLHLFTHRRSQDLFFGLTYDAPWEMLLMQSMISELKERGVENVELGSYKIFIGSAHIYERNFQKINEMLEHRFESESLNNHGYLPLNNEVVELAETGKVNNPEIDFTKWLIKNIGA